MYFRIQLFAILGSILIAIGIFELIRKRKLMEKYSLLWFGSAMVLLLFSFWRGLLEKLAWILGVEYAPSVLIVIAIFCGMLLALHFTVVISKLTEQNKVLAQELALLRTQLNSTRKNASESLVEENSEPTTKHSVSSESK